MESSSPFGAVVTSHTNPHLSGVAKFNEQLARRWNVPCLGFGDQRIPEGRLLLSLKLSDATDAESERVRSFLGLLRQRGVSYDVFWHTYDSSALESEVLEGCDRVFSGNAEITHALEAIDKPLQTAWCPGLVLEDEVVRERPLNLFSFGMAHKIQVKYYLRLKECLERHQDDYSLWMSTAFHEKANFGDFDSISSQMRDIFGKRIHFLGFLSDAAVNYFLDKSHFFISFFSKGVRANNTSVNAAMSRGSVVLTNLDEHSPEWLRHGYNMLDVHQMEENNFKSDHLGSMAKVAKETAQTSANWAPLLQLLGGERQKAILMKSSTRE
jgi:hypothetical protein